MRANVPGLREALAGLERRFREQDAPVWRRLRPGLSEDEIAAFTAGLGFCLSDELRCFYKWHDGVFDGSGPEWPYFPGGRILSPLAQAVEERADWLANWPGESMADELDNVYEPTWLPINSGGYALVVECGVRPGQASPIHFVDYHSEWELNCAPSLLYVVRLWNRMIDDGYWAYDPEGAEWDRHSGDIPSDLRRRGLV